MNNRPDFILLQNQSIVPGWSFIISVHQPFYVARVHSFASTGEAREFCLLKAGIMVAGRNTCLVFEGVADRDQFPVSINYRSEIEGFMKGAALWMQAHCSPV